MTRKHLIVGLGNPGKEYEKTRHNIGFEVVKAYGQKHGVSFRENSKINGYVAKIANQEIVYLLMPLTYMNLSGEAVLKCLNYFEITDLNNLLVVVDDADLDYGQFRLKPSGSTGGHNGLKSIEEHLHTKDFSRLRIGIGRGKADLADYVLSRFTLSEQEQLLKILDKGGSFIDMWLKKDMQEAMNLVNIRNTKEEEK